MNISAKTDQVLALLARSSELDYIGEPISQLAHALQAAFFAEKASAPATEVLAALFHDIGHYCGEGTAAEMGGFGVRHHEEIGARYLDEAGFPKDVGELVRGHVQAKRYLVYKNSLYGERLSEASTRTLAYQGGPMTAEEAAAFERDPLLKAKLRVRSWDEQAKIPDLVVPDLESYRPMIRQCLSGGPAHEATSDRPGAGYRSGSAH